MKQATPNVELVRTMYVDGGMGAVGIFSLTIKQGIIKIITGASTPHLKRWQPLRERNLRTIRPCGNRRRRVHA